MKIISKLKKAFLEKGIASDCLDWILGLPDAKPHPIARAYGTRRVGGYEYELWLNASEYRVIAKLRRTFLGLRRDFAQIELSQIYL